MSINNKSVKVELLITLKQKSAIHNIASHTGGCALDATILKPGENKYYTRFYYT